MSDLFVAADRLQKDPSDAAVAGEFYMAADAAAVTAAPFGIDTREWQQVQELAASLVASCRMETAIDDDVLSRDAAALRAVLAPPLRIDRPYACSMAQRPGRARDHATPRSVAPTRRVALGRLVASGVPAVPAPGRACSWPASSR